MSHFPAEIWCMIATQLSPAERIVLASASKTLASIIYETETLWVNYDMSRDQQQKPGIIKACRIRQDGEKDDDPASSVADVLTLLLNLKISPAAKTGIRHVSFDNQQVCEADFRTTFKSCSSLETLSFQHCNSSTITAFAHFLDSLAISPIRLPNLRRITVRGCQNPEDILWADIRRIRDNLRHIFNADLVFDLDLGPCHVCNGCAEPEASPCRVCSTTSNTWCRRCQSNRGCVSCDSRICEFCLGTGQRHRFAGCDRHRICITCEPSHECSVCKVPCCPADGCRRGSFRCKQCDVIVCRDCVGRVKFCRQCGLCSGCKPWKRAPCDKCGQRFCGSKCLKGHLEECGGLKSETGKRRHVASKFQCLGTAKTNKVDVLLPNKLDVVSPKKKM